LKIDAAWASETLVSYQPHPHTAPQPRSHDDDDDDDDDDGAKGDYDDEEEEEEEEEEENIYFRISDSILDTLFMMQRVTAGFVTSYMSLSVSILLLSASYEGCNKSMSTFILR
jgi:hypothetical protein